MKYFLLCILLIIISATIAESQIVNSWVSVDTANRPYLQNYRTKYFEILNNQKIVSIDQVFGNTQPFLKRSSDAGATWDYILENEIYAYEFNTISYPADGHIYVAGDSTHYIGVEKFDPLFIRQAMIMSSSDDGQTWNKVQFDTNSYITYLDMSGALTGIASKRIFSNKYNTVPNYGDTIIWTNDGFKTYEKIILPENGFRIAELKCFDENTFIVNVHNNTQGIYKYVITYDKGQTWEDLFNSGGIRFADFIDENTVYILKNNPDLNGATNVLLTTDRGKNWELCFSSAQSEPIVCLSAADKNNILIAGQKCKMYKSSDAGKSWQQEYIPYGENGGIDMGYVQFDAIEYKNLNTAYSIISSRLYKMTDKLALARPILNRYSDRISPFGIISEWNKIEGAKSYRYQIAPTNSSVFSYYIFDNIIIDTVMTDNILFLPDLNYNFCYYGRIKAIGDGIESDWSIAASQFCTLVDSNYVQPPFFITPQSNEHISGEPLEFIWTSVPDAERYEFQINVVPSITQGIIYEGSTSDTNIFVINLSYPTTQMFARVRVSDGKIMSDWRTVPFYYADPLSVNSEFSKDGISIYPNPVNSILNIKLSNLEKGDYEIRVSNVSGQTVIFTEQQNQSETMNINLDVNKLTKGAYYFTVVYEMKIIKSGKFIVE